MLRSCYTASPMCVGIPYGRHKPPLPETIAHVGRLVDARVLKGKAVEKGTRDRRREMRRRRKVGACRSRAHCHRCDSVVYLRPSPRSFKAATLRAVFPAANVRDRVDNGISAGNDEDHHHHHPSTHVPIKIAGRLMKMFFLRRDKWRRYISEIEERDWIDPRGKGNKFDYSTRLIR